MDQRASHARSFISRFSFPLSEFPSFESNEYADALSLPDTTITSKVPDELEWLQSYILPQDFEYFERLSKYTDEVLVLAFNAIKQARYTAARANSTPRSMRDDTISTLSFENCLIPSTPPSFSKQTTACSRRGSSPITGKSPPSDFYESEIDSNFSVSEGSESLEDDPFYSPSPSPRPVLRLIKPSKRFACTFPACEASYSTKTAWREHESTHQPTQIWRCASCKKASYNGSDYFTEKDAFMDALHIKVRAPEPSCPHHTVSLEPLPARSTWGCGFCIKTFRDWNARCDHVFQHLDDGVEVMQWSRSNVIYSFLMDDDVVAPLWDRLLSEFHESGSWPFFWWPDEVADDLQKALELREFPKGVEEFVKGCYYTGVGTTPKLEEAEFVAPGTPIHQQRRSLEESIMKHVQETARVSAQRRKSQRDNAASRGSPAESPSVKLAGNHNTLRIPKTSMDLNTLHGFSYNMESKDTLKPKTPWTAIKCGIVKKVSRSSLRTPPSRPPPPPPINANIISNNNNNTKPAMQPAPTADPTPFLLSSSPSSTILARSPSPSFSDPPLTASTLVPSRPTTPDPEHTRTTSIASSDEVQTLLDNFFQYGFDKSLALGRDEDGRLRPFPSPRKNRANPAYAQQVTCEDVCFDLLPSPGKRGRGK